MNCTPIVRHTSNNWGAFLMAEFSDSDKLAAVLRYLENKELTVFIVDSWGIDKEDLELWINRYEYHDIDAFVKSYTTCLTI